MSNGAMRAWDGTAWQTLPAAAPNPGSIAQAINVNFAPAGTISSSNVQAAVEEVATDYIAADGVVTAAYQAADALRPTSTTLATSGGANLIGFTVPSGTATTVQTQLRRYVDVKQYGAVGDGTTNDAPAIQAAFNALDNNTIAEVYFPPGTYRLSSAITIGSKRVHIRGAGQGLTILKGEVVSGALVYIAQDSYLHYTTIEDMTLTTNQVNSVTGIHVEFSVSDATNNRTTDRLILRNLQLIPSNFNVTGWYRGIELVNCHAATLENINIMGTGYASGMESGVFLANYSTGAPTDFVLHNVKVYYGITGFKGIGHIEGVNISQCFAIAVQVGYDFRLDANYPWFSLTHSHANVTSQGVHLENFSQSFIDHNLIYIVNQGAGSTPVGISIKGSNDCIIDCNNVVNPIAVGGTTVVGYYVENCVSTKLANNKVAGFNVGYWLAGTTDFTRTFDNEAGSGYPGNTPYNMAASGGSNVVRNTP